MTAPGMGIGRSTIVENHRGQRAIVSEHPGDVYLSVEGAMFLNPIDALAIARALIEGAGAAIERQFQQQHQQSGKDRQ